MMKKYLLLLCFFLGGILFVHAQSIVMDIEVLDYKGEVCGGTLPVTVTQNGVTTPGKGTVLISVANMAGATQTTAPAYKIKPSISVPVNYVKITGVRDLPEGWTICSQDNGTITFSNSVPMPEITAVEFLVELEVTATAEDAQGANVTPNVFWGGGTESTACKSGPPLPGDQNTTFGKFANVNIGGPLIILPVEITGLKVQRKGETSLLSWRSTEENNFSEFKVEKSIDGKKYIQIGTVAAKGNNSAYSFVDASPATGINYYRLRMVDKDSKFGYSNVVSLNFTAQSGAITVQPNPATTSFNIHIGSGNAGEYKIAMFNAMGQLVYEGRQSIAATATVIPVQRPANCAAGNYVLRINNTTTGTATTEKMVLK